MAILHRAYYVSQELQTTVLQKHRSKSGSYTHRSHARGQCIVVYRASVRGLCSLSQVTPRMTMTLSFVSQPARKGKGKGEAPTALDDLRASSFYCSLSLGSLRQRQRPSTTGERGTRLGHTRTAAPCASSGMVPRSPLVESGNAPCLFLANFGKVLNGGHLHIIVVLFRQDPSRDYMSVMSKFIGLLEQHVNRW